MRYKNNTYSIMTICIIMNNIAVTFFLLCMSIYVFGFLCSSASIKLVLDLDSENS